MAKKKNSVEVVATESTKETLKASIEQCVKLAHEVMLEDRSTVLRLKNVVGKLKDALNVIK